MTAAHVTLCLVSLVLLSAALHVAAKTNDTTSTTASATEPTTTSSAPTTPTFAPTTTSSAPMTTATSTGENQPIVCGRKNNKHEALCRKMCSSDGWKHGKCVNRKCTCSEQKL